MYLDTIFCAARKEIFHPGRQIPARKNTLYFAKYIGIVFATRRALARLFLLSPLEIWAVRVATVHWAFRPPREREILKQQES
jgi:hypothetical protein